MKRKKWEQFVENKKNDSVVKVITIQELHHFTFWGSL